MTSSASGLKSILDRDKKWTAISDVWMEMLAYVTSQCRGNYHAQQLQRGGEFLTRVASDDGSFWVN